MRHEKACRRKKAKESKRHSDAEDEFERAMKAFNLAKSLLDKAEQAVDVAARLHHNAEIHKFRIIDILRQSGFSLSTDFLSPRSSASKLCLYFTSFFLNFNIDPIVLRTTPNEIQMVEVAVHLD